MSLRSFFSPFFFLGFLAVIVGGSVWPSPARAGFQWVTPTASATDQTTTATVAAPVPAVSQPVTIEGSAPVIIEAPAVASPPASVAPETKEVTDTRKPLVEVHGPAALTKAVAPSLPPINEKSAPSTAALPMAPAPSATTPDLAAQQGHVLVPPASADEGPVLNGFGNSIPLVVALRQILPPGIAFTSAKDVDMGTLVSWKGGQTWRPTLRETLQQAGLTVTEQGQMIQIMRATDTQAAAVSPAPAPVPAPQTLVPPPGVSPVLPSKDIAPLQPVGVPVVVSPTASDVPRETVVDSWTANRGSTLRNTLEQWCGHANIELSWQAEYDYPLQATISVTGTFEEAVRNLLTGFQDAQPQPIGRLHMAPAGGQTVLLIQARGNSYND